MMIEVRSTVTLRASVSIALIGACRIWVHMDATRAAKIDAYAGTRLGSACYISTSPLPSLLLLSSLPSSSSSWGSQGEFFDWWKSGGLDTLPWICLADCELVVLAI